MLRYMVSLTLGVLVCAGALTEAAAQGEGEKADVKAEAVAYLPGRPAVKGHLAVPAGKGPFPAMVLIHEWWGLNDQIRAEAERFARAGYVALAVDLYEGTVASTPNEARAAMGKVKPDTALANLNGAVAYLQKHGAVKPDRIGSVGWCFGGGQSLQLALHNAALAAAVIYYGRLESDPERLKQISCPVLGQFGAEDSHPSPEQVAAFEKGLKAAKVPHEVYSYPNANHAFANPTGTRYNRVAAEKAWERTMAFLEKHLKK